MTIEEFQTRMRATYDQTLAAMIAAQTAHEDAMDALFKETEAMDALFKETETDDAALIEACGEVVNAEVKRFQGLLTEARMKMG